MKLDKNFIKTYLGKDASLVCADETCSVVKVTNETGEGIMTTYAPFPGILVVFNDFHMDAHEQGYQSPMPSFCLNHCQVGRIEWRHHDGRYCYLEAGDFLLSMHPPSESGFSLPLNHYHGISIAMHPEIIEAETSPMLESISIDVKKLVTKFCPGNRGFIARGGPRIDHVFSELYAASDTNRLDYIKVKTLEILLFLDSMEISEHNIDRPYYYKTHVDKVKAIMEFITMHPERHYSLNELSDRFEFPLTSMKNCFKGVYGTPIYAFMKQYRMNAAAVLLRDENLSVTEVASRMGYDNASKFSAAFKSVLGHSPSSYRKNETN